jgi:hypothetical protein
MHLRSTHRHLLQDALVLSMLETSTLAIVGSRMNMRIRD